MKSTKKKELQYQMHGSDLVFTVIMYIVLALLFVIELYPLIYIVSASFSDPNAVASGEMMLWPVRPTLNGYKYILNYTEIWIGYRNTILYTLIGTLINLVVTLPAAYAVSRKDMKGKGFLMLFYMFTMYFSGGLTPSYLNIKSFGLIDNPLVMILNGALSVYNMIVARTFFSSTIPYELHEAARIDGCDDFKTFCSIVLPLSAPIIAVLAIYYGVGHWNAYFNAMIYLDNRHYYPLQLFLKEILVQSKLLESALKEMGGDLTAEEMIDMMKQAETANLIKYCVIIASTLPMLVIYPFLQRYFSKGVMIGAVKG